MAKIIIIEGQKTIRLALRDILEYEGHEVDEAKDGVEGIEKILEKDYDVALCCIMMPNMNGFEVLFHAYEAGSNTQIIIISARGSRANVIEANRLGAFDFIVKPPDLNHLLETISNAIDKRRQVDEHPPFRRKLYRVNQIIGESPLIMYVKESIKKVADTKVNVLISGPSGVGKGLAARNIHQQTSRVRRPFSTINCANSPDELLERELFGHEKGAFTGAATKRIGKLEKAEGGTLFLDNIDTMSLAVQAKLMQAMLEQSFTRIGGSKSVNVSVRFLSATRKDLREEVTNGHFRADLYYYLSEYTLDIPALADRREDIPLLIDKFLNDSFSTFCIREKTIEPAAVAYLTELPWLQNSRELRDAIEKLTVMCDEAITLDEVKQYV